MTIAKFIGIWAIVFFVFMLIGMTCLIIYTTEQATDDVARRTLARDASRAARHVVMKKNGDLVIEIDKQRRLHQDTVVLLLAKDGVLDGDYPMRMQEVVEVPFPKKVDERFRAVKTEEGDYYLFDHRLRMIRSDERQQGRMMRVKNDVIYIRAVLRTEDIDTIYDDIQKLYGGFVIVLLILVGLGGIWMYRKAARPLDEMCKSVQMITERQDYTERIDNTGLFYETDIMTDAYNKLMERTQRLAMQQDEFNENVSHELRTPVALIRSECELIEDIYQKHLPKEVRDAIQVIHDQSDRMSMMIGELLYLARMNREGNQIHREQIDLVDLAESACEDAEELNKGQWVFVYDLQPAEAAIDVALVIIAVRNLITNAMKYSLPGSTIRISTGIDQDMAFLRVCDEGVGISEEDQKKIFTPYYQVKGERNSNGFGLGLPLAQKIAERHGGEIRLESVPGQGSTFTLLLPREAKDA